VELNYYEATSTFTLVTTRIVAHPAIRGFVDGLQKATFPSPPAIQATGLPAITLAGLSPASACGPSLGTHKFNEMTLTGRRCTASEMAASSVLLKACESEESLIAETMAFAKSLQKKRGVFGEMKRRLHAGIVEVIDKEDPKYIEPLKLLWKD